MRNNYIVLFVCALIGGALFADDAAKGVDEVIQDLESAEGSAPSSVSVPVEPLTESEVDALAEQSRKQYVGGEFAEAQRGFEQIVKIDPENRMARMYLRTLKERDQRNAEISGMDAVDAAWSTDLVFRSYALDADALQQMELTDAGKSQDVTFLFPQVGFPKGASAVFQPDLSAIFVRNTLENFAVLEAILEAMDLAKFSSIVDQVEIEAKFVEVSEGTLEELGFQWNFDDPTHVGMGGTDLDVDDGSGGLFADALRGSPNGVLGMPFSRPADLGSSLGGGVDAVTAAESGWRTFRFEDTFNREPASLLLENRSGSPVEILLSALDQSTGADVLSAPRVVTQSGQEATIRVGELHYYPEVYEGDNDQGTLLNVAYKDFTETLLGVELAVTPEVDGTHIELDLAPRITEISGWDNYQLAPENSLYNVRSRGSEVVYQHEPIVARLPVFKIREVDTSVTIADGGTIGMGGLMSEKIEAFEDRVPVLGHIPLLGRLFRNEGERAIKRNLLMFVTARKVEPSGRVNTSRIIE